MPRCFEVGCLATSSRTLFGSEPSGFSGALLEFSFVPTGGVEGAAVRRPDWAVASPEPIPIPSNNMTTVRPDRFRSVRTKLRDKLIMLFGFRRRWPEGHIVKP